MHTQHMPHIMIVNRLEANKERFRPEGFDQIRPQSIRVRDISSPAIWATIWRRSHGRQKCRPNGLIKLIN